MVNIKTWLGIGILSLGTLFPINLSDAHHKPRLEESIKQEEKFKGLWRIIEEYVGLDGSNQDELLKEKNRELSDYVNENYLWSPELFDGNEFNYDKLKDFCISNKRLLYSVPLDQDHPENRIFATGKVIEEYKEKFSFREEKLEYKVVIFEEGIRSNNTTQEIIPLAWWNNSNRTAFMDITELDNIARDIYNFGSKGNPDNGEFGSFMRNELYKSIKKNTKNKDEFIQKFKKIIIKSNEKHERMHHFYPYGKNLSESRRDEAETYLYQISQDNKFNSWAFLVTSENPNNNKYDRLYNFFKEKGYTKKDLMKLTPKERSKIAKEVLDSL